MTDGCDTTLNRSQGRCRTKPADCLRRCDVSKLSWSEQTQTRYDGPVVCRCCERSGKFETPEQAHGDGWDVAPYFALSPLCDRCLSALYTAGTCRHGEPATTD